MDPIHLHPDEYERVKARAIADDIGYHEAYVRLSVEALQEVSDGLPENQ